MPKGVRKARRDDTDFTQYKEGGKGERYLPKKAREALSPAEYAATTKAKRAGTKGAQALCGAGIH
jgi:hypothetical protein